MTEVFHFLFELFSTMAGLAVAAYAILERRLSNLDNSYQTEQRTLRATMAGQWDQEHVVESVVLADESTGWSLSSTRETFGNTIGPPRPGHKYRHDSEFRMKHWPSTLHELETLPKDEIWTEQLDFAARLLRDESGIDLTPRQQALWAAVASLELMLRAKPVRQLERAVVLSLVWSGVGALAALIFSAAVA